MIHSLGIYDHRIIYYASAQYDLLILLPMGHQFKKIIVVKYDTKYIFFLGWYGCKDMHFFEVIPTSQCQGMPPRHGSPLWSLSQGRGMLA